MSVGDGEDLLSSFSLEEAWGRERDWTPFTNGTPLVPLVSVPYRPLSLPRMPVWRNFSVGRTTWVVWNIFLYFLSKATRDPYYLHVGKSIVESLNRHARVECGFAAVQDVRTGRHEDR